MGFKITLDDGRTFEEGQEVEFQSFVDDAWMKFTVSNCGGYRDLDTYAIIKHPNRVRHIAQKVKRKRTAREVDQIINVDRRRWIMERADQINIGGVVSEMKHGVVLEGWPLSAISYESKSGEWLPLAEVEE